MLVIAVVTVVGSSVLVITVVTVVAESVLVVEVVTVVAGLVLVAEVVIVVAGLVLVFEVVTVVAGFVVVLVVVTTGSPGHPLASLAFRRALICPWKRTPFLSTFFPAVTASQIMNPPKFLWQKYASISGLSWAEDTAKSLEAPELASPRIPMASLAFLLLEPGA